jgi:transglutaminase-like putative cysteine protease
LLALDPVLAPGSWTVTAALAVLGTAAVVAALRLVLASPLAPSGIGAALVVAGLLLGYGLGSDQDAASSGVPGTLAALVRVARAQIQDGLVPLTVTPEVTALVVAGALAVFLLLDLATAMRAPALGGLAPATLWIPAMVLGYPASGWALIWAGLPWLLLLALTTAARTTDLGRAAAWSAGLLTITLVAAPLAVALPTWRTGTLPALGSAGSVSLSDNLDLRRDLLGQSGQPVLRYTVKPATADGPSPTDARVDPRTVGPLRSFTVRSFDGRSWKVDAPSASAVQVRSSLLLQPASTSQLQPADPSTADVVDVEVLNLADRHLPITTATFSLSVGGQWRYDPVADQVLGSATTSSGMRYSMLTALPSLSAEQLDAADTSGLLDATPYLAVPDTAHSTQIAALAAQVTETARTPYQRAVALQNFFRNPGQFSYDPRVAAATSDDAVWDFLNDRRGYCVQFATAMAIMARTLGLPSRVGVGFLPGDVGADGAVTVSGRSAHAWPELWFGGIGWVRFEPTPAVQSGAPPAWTVPTATATAAPTADSRPSASAGAAPSATASGAAAAAGPRGVGSGSTAGRITLGVGAGALLAVAALVIALLRRRSRPALDPERAWSTARRVAAAAGLGWTDATTPRQAAEQVRAQLAERSAAPAAPADLDAASALRALATEVERARYTVRGSTATPEQLRQWLDRLRGALPAARR